MPGGGLHANHRRGSMLLPRLIASAATGPVATPLMTSPTLRCAITALAVSLAPAAARAQFQGWESFTRLKVDGSFEAGAGLWFPDRPQLVPALGVAGADALIADLKLGPTLGTRGALNFGLASLELTAAAGLWPAASGTGRSLF